jgi:hypothetical protein
MSRRAMKVLGIRLQAGIEVRQMKAPVTASVNKWCLLTLGKVYWQGSCRCCMSDSTAAIPAFGTSA